MDAAPECGVELPVGALSKDTGDQSLQEEVVNDERKQSPRLTPPQDDFLTIVPKPTLLSREKAKKRLQAFNLTKLNAYYNTKKKQAEEALAKNASYTAKVIPAADCNKKMIKKQVSPARETIEAIEKCKMEQLNLQIPPTLKFKKWRDAALKNLEEYKDRRPETARVRSRSPEKICRRNRDGGSKTARTFRDKRKRSCSRDVVRDEQIRANHRECRDEINRDRHSKETINSLNPSRIRSLGSNEVKDNHVDKPFESWSDCNDDCLKNSVDKVTSDLKDIRKMLLFDSMCYNMKPFQFRKIDGSLVTVSMQLVRYTVKSTPRIAYSPNPTDTKSAYFQREDTFATISSSQKEGILNLINQAAEKKPLAPCKPQKARNWYTEDYLKERHADESIYYDSADVIDVVLDENDKIFSKVKSKSKKRKSKRKSEREIARKERKMKKMLLERVQQDDQDVISKLSELEDDKLANSGVIGPKLSAERDTIVAKQYQRTDSHKSDTDSINSIDHVLDNHVSSHSHDDNGDEVSSQNCIGMGHSEPKTPPMRISAADSNTSLVSSAKSVEDSSPLKSSKTSNSSSFSPMDKIEYKKLSRSEIIRNHHMHNAHQNDGKPNKAVISAKLRKHLLENNCKPELSESRFDQHHIKSYSKKPAPPQLPLSTLSIPVPQLTTPTKIYKIKNDCLDKDMAPVLYNMNMTVNDHKILPEVKTISSKPLNIVQNAKMESDIDNITIKKQLFSRFEPLPEMAEKKTPIEKLKSKPSELYSPTLQSLPSDSSDSETEMPDSNEYRSHWESEEELDVKENTAWESEEESIHIDLPRVTPTKAKGLEERSLEMPLNINISRKRSKSTEVKLFDDLDVATSWDIDAKHNAFDLSPDIPTSDGKPDLEDEYMQFMSSVSSLEEPVQIQRPYSSSSSSSTSSSSSSSTQTDASSRGQLSTSNEMRPLPTIIAGHQDINLPLTQGSPICNVDSTSSPAVQQDEKEYKSPLTLGKALPTIVLAKKNPLIGCSLFKDDDSDTEIADLGGKNSRRQSPTSRRESPRRTSPSTVRHYNRSRRRSPNRRESSPKRLDSKDVSPRRDKRERGMSPRRTSPRRAGSPKRVGSPRRGISPRLGSPNRDSSPRSKDIEKKQNFLDNRKREGRDGWLSPRRRSPKHCDGNRSPSYDTHIRSDPKHRSMAELYRYRDFDRERDKHDRFRDRDRKYRDGSPRFRESPARYSPTRRRSSPRHRYSPKRERSPRYRDRSPRRRSLSPTRRIYSRSTSRERKESITQALHRIAGMDYEMPKSPGTINSPMDGYIRGVADSTISDEQLLQNIGTEFNSTQSPVYYNPPFKSNEGSPKRMPLDDRINQVLGIDAGKQADMTYSENYYNQVYYDQYGTMPSNHPNYDQNYKHYNRHLVALNSVSSKVVQVGNVLQVVPTEQDQANVAGSKKGGDFVLDPNYVDMAQKFVPVGNMLEIVPTAELPVDVAPAVTAQETQEAKLAEELMKIRTAERKAEREKRRRERERRRKEKEAKRKEREQRRQLKLKMKSEALMKKVLKLDKLEETPDEDTKVPTVSMDSTGVRMPKGILVIRASNSENNLQAEEEPRLESSARRQRKEVKFADGVLPGEGTSPSGGEELSSPPPFPRLPKEKRYTKTKKPKNPKSQKKKIKVKIVRTKFSKSGDTDDDNLPPPSPPPGSPPPHVFPPRIKQTLINPAYYSNYPFNHLNCTAFPSDSPHQSFPGMPNIQYQAMTQFHLPQGLPPPTIAGLPPMHPIPILLPPPAPSRFVAKPISKPNGKGI